MIRNKALRLVLFNLLLIGASVTLNVINVLVMRWILNTLLSISRTGPIVIGLIGLVHLWILVAIAYGIFSRLLLRETWISNVLYAIESFVVLYLSFNLSPKWPSHFSEWLGYFISALFLCVVSSSASLITWIIQCKVQKEQVAKQITDCDD